MESFTFYGDTCCQILQVPPWTGLNMVVISVISLAHFLGYMEVHLQRSVCPYVSMYNVCLFEGLFQSQSILINLHLLIIRSFIDLWIFVSFQITQKSQVITNK